MTKRHRLIAWFATNRGTIPQAMQAIGVSKTLAYRIADELIDAGRPEAQNIVKRPWHETEPPSLQTSPPVESVVSIALRSRTPLEMFW